MVSTVNPDDDSDHDGMNDAWEIDNFGDLSHDGSADSDNDGYSDLWEYLNFSQGIMDPAGNPFDPNEPNAPGGAGHNAGETRKSIWIMMMPAILSGVNGR